MKKLGLVGVVVLMLVSTSFTFAQSVRTTSGVMNAVNSSGVTGTFTITEAGANDIMVKATFKGFQPNSAHAGHIHMGTCEKQGAVIFLLQAAKADASGNATISWPVNHIGFDEVLGNPFPFYIQYHQADSPPGDAVVCGNITAATTTAAASGGATSLPTGAPASGFGGNSGEGSLNLYLLGGLVVMLPFSVAIYGVLRRKKNH